MRDLEEPSKLIKRMERIRNRLEAQARDRYPALVIAFGVGLSGERSLDADVKCGNCGTYFRFKGVPAPDFGRDFSLSGKQEQAAASTGPWLPGRCPDCRLAHRVRATIVVSVEPELRALVASDGEDDLVESA